MSSRFDYLQQQFETYDQSESWKIDHDNAMACWDLEDVIRLGLTLYESTVRKWDVPYLTSADARSICGLYKQWMERTSRILRAATILEAKGYKLEEVGHLRQKYRLVVDSFPELERMSHSLEAFSTDGFMSLEEAERELLGTDCK